MIDINKEKTYKYIKNFSKITVNNICKKNKITYQNVMSGKASTDKIEKVKEDIEKEIAKLYIGDDDDVK